MPEIDAHCTLLVTSVIMYRFFAPETSRQAMCDCVLVYLLKKTKY